MIFNSFHFVLFYIVIVATYFATPFRCRWILLLAASYYFYMCWRVDYTVLLVGTTVIDYCAALLIERSSLPRVRRILLAISLMANLGVLFTFKYWTFFWGSVAAASHSIGFLVQVPGLEVLLPVGISFYTFQSMSYTIDVYRGLIKAERHFGIFALYVSFFPQLVAGPIERSGNLLPQFRQRHHLNYQRVSSGLRLMLWGALKKIAIADQIAPVVQTVYATPQEFSGPILLLATFFFAIQIYCDFSGYSDIAIGCARVMGYDLMTNFLRPYFATSIGNFWRRWHISLSTWFKDYLYVPLGGSRVSTARHALNLMIVFVVSGIWHGAAATFVAWGALHGVCMVAESLGRHYFPVKTPKAAWPLVRIAKSLAVFAIVLAGWVFFRAQSLSDALYILTHVGSLDGFTTGTLWLLGLPRFELGVAAVGIAVLFGIELIQEAQPSFALSLWRRRPLRWALYLAGMYGIVFFGVLKDVEFIYFQF